MLQYDLSGTRFFESETRLDLPTDAEVFAITAALLLMQDVAYGELASQELELTADAVENLAQCIEYRLAVFTRDVGGGHRLRQRLEAFVGLRIAGVVTCSMPDSRKPT
jgi:hypothetical protein